MEKILLVFGYFLIFEYAIISREYALGVLCVVVFSTMFRSTLRKHYILIAIPLVLLIQTSAYGVMIAAALTLAALYAVYVIVVSIMRPQWVPALPAEARTLREPDGSS